MPRLKRDAKYMNLYVASDVADAVADFSEETGIPKSRIVENAVRDYISSHTEESDGEKRYHL